MNGRGVSAAAAADTNRRAALRAYAAGESTWPSSARSALAATRTARALVAENRIRVDASMGDASPTNRRRTIRRRTIRRRTIRPHRPSTNRPSARRSRRRLARWSSTRTIPPVVWPRRICSSPPATTRRRRTSIRSRCITFPFSAKRRRRRRRARAPPRRLWRTDWRHISWNCRRARRRRRWRVDSLRLTRRRARARVGGRSRAGRRREPPRGARHGTHAEAPRERRGVDARARVSRRSLRRR